MSWISDVVAPKLKAFIGVNSSIKDNLWTKCPGCDRMIHANELHDNLMVCVYCSHHFHLNAPCRFEMTFDDGVYQQVDNVKVKDDPIKFKDIKKYADRLKEARNKTGLDDCISIAHGKIGGIQSVAFVMSFSFMGGSMGLAFGKSFSKAVDLAISLRAPLIGFTASGGARMQEGMFSLMQMPATIASICDLRESKLPYVNVFTNPTTGGVLASFATLGDALIAEPNALIGFAGARVIEKTMKSKLPDGFQKSEFLLRHGMIDMIAHRHDMTSKLKLILGYISGRSS
ncbi:MAG: acetyl-CoA carboxylase, carboxyltransferase subunit beta [Holosporales bacterium]|jgi:acetyl-CoA carboxylase carboxyl transferase subunit beta|nr:acetyl-CoA carboxylase, carboxyltransferase subunit beta [Holosporales bacterium]